MSRHDDSSTVLLEVAVKNKLSSIYKSAETLAAVIESKLLRDYQFLFLIMLLISVSIYLTMQMHAPIQITEMLAELSVVVGALWIIMFTSQKIKRRMMEKKMHK